MKYLDCLINYKSMELIHDESGAYLALRSVIVSTESVSEIHCEISYGTLEQRPGSGS